MKLTRAFQIQKQYQRHKQRLCSIKSLDAKRKVSTSTYKNVDKINNFKKIKSNSFFHKDYNKQWDIKQQNLILHKTLTKVYSRDPTSLIIKGFEQQQSRMSHRVSSQSSMRSLQQSRIKQENSKFSKKITLAKSTYRKFREKSKKNSDTKQNNRKQEVIKILESQLGFKPRVIFPSVKIKKQKQININSLSKK